MYNELKNVLPEDHARQVNSKDVLQAYVANGLRPKSILDFGCGDGRSFDFFKQVLPDSSWCGVDIEISPEVKSRTRNDATFVTYNGETLPFDEGEFDLVYSNQVLEHVRNPDMAMKQVCKVLTSKGLFIGQTSQFEPYHSFSLWNFTLYGFKTIVESAGMKLLELRPSIDGFTLMERSFKGRPKEYSKYFSEESPLNKEIEESAILQNKSARIINHRKLQYCGQFCFVIQKP